MASHDCDESPQGSHLCLLSSEVTPVPREYLPMRAAQSLLNCVLHLACITSLSPCNKPRSYFSHFPEEERGRREVRLLSQGHPPLVSQGARVPTQIYLTVKQISLPGAVCGSSAENGGLGSSSTLSCGRSNIHTASQVSEFSAKTFHRRCAASPDNFPH